MTQEDLLSHFDECITFIDTALSNKNRILVHWYGIINNIYVSIIEFL